MKIYTRTGDEGQTGLIGDRRSKDDSRVEAYGTIDELNAFIGDAIAKLDREHADLIDDLTIIQHHLFDAGGDLAQVGKNRSYKVHAHMVDDLEQLIDRYDAKCPPIRFFILPGGVSQAAALHLCRVIARSAERRVVTLCRLEEANVEVRRYLNRLSDLLFTMARVVNVRAKREDIPYKSDQKFKKE